MKDAPDPGHIEKERERLIVHIEDVFSRVSREGGTSWAEADVIDCRGSDDDRIAARERETDRHWTDLVEDPNWRVEVYSGGFSFLDSIGFRYYLPAAMIRTLREGELHCMLDHTLTLPPEGEFRARTLERWSALTRAQRLCVARFIRFMVALAAARGDPMARDGSKRLRDTGGKFLELLVLGDEAGCKPGPLVTWSGCRARRARRPPHGQAEGWPY